MLKVLELEKVNGFTYKCSVYWNGQKYLFSMIVKQPMPMVRSLEFVSLSDEIEFSLTNADEYRAFLKLFWKYVDGETIYLPCEVESDW
tara:strand:- start:597 stop:860 length:264 start_codon:yes stop_codon:yes gene_type:complete